MLFMPQSDQLNARAAAASQSRMYFLIFWRIAMDVALLLVLLQGLC